MTQPYAHTAAALKAHFAPNCDNVQFVHNPAGMEPGWYMVTERGMNYIAYDAEIDGDGEYIVDRTGDSDKLILWYKPGHGWVDVK